MAPDGYVDPIDERGAPQHHLPIVIQTVGDDVERPFLAAHRLFDERLDDAGQDVTDGARIQQPATARGGRQATQREDGADHAPWRTAEPRQSDQLGRREFGIGLQRLPGRHGDRRGQDLEPMSMGPGRRGGGSHDSPGLVDADPPTGRRLVRGQDDAHDAGRRRVDLHGDGPTRHSCVNGATGSAKRAVLAPEATLNSGLALETFL